MMQPKITCPHCGGPVHRKNKKHIASLGQTVQRYYCDPKTLGGCSKYHLRSLDTGEVVEATRPVRETAKANPEDEAAQLLGIDPATLQPTAKGSSGRPRIIINCLSGDDLEHLNDDWRERTERLQEKALLINACLGAIRRGLVAEKMASRGIAQ